MATASPRSTPKRKSVPKARTAPRPAAATRVASIMTKDVVTVAPETSVETAIALMVEGDLSRLPVVDDQQRLVGLFSKSDVVRNRHEVGDTSELLDRARIPGKYGVRYPLNGVHLEDSVATVGELMTRSVLTVRATDTVEKAAELLSSHHLHGLPVVTAEGELEGIVSALDVVRWVVRQA